MREGRKKEFEKYNLGSEPPDAQDEATFHACVIDWDARESGQHKILLNWHKALIRLRRSYDVFQNFSKNDISCRVLSKNSLAVFRHDTTRTKQGICVMNFSQEKLVEFALPEHATSWQVLLNSVDEQWLPDTIAIATRRPVSSNKIIIPPFGVIVFYGEKQGESL